ncbi:oligoendopeptidase F [Evansella caseinilytica]|uniref:Oligoendopeptidase F n=1 Tax=Evansella caseinilytica TaxID=1503961 RepID=A0A1H3QUP9_9BACI|nr:M3 family oligoendopeptidase [Evansella caseinilytica]SDZ16993.1 oligoendopeptidase F [Evansella caseinilytica]
MNKCYVEKLDFSNLERLEENFKALLNMPLETLEEMETWLQAQSELYDAMQESLYGHYIDFQCQSDSEAAKNAFEYDQKNVEPLFKRYVAALDEQFLTSPAKALLDKKFYAQFLKRKQNAKELFREENVELEIEEDRLTTNYFEHTGGLTVDWNGEEKTLSQLQQYFEDADSEVRKQAFTLTSEAFLSKQKELQTIMSELITLRQQKAKNADLANYRDFMFKKYERFDYSPEDCKQLAKAVQLYVKPLKEKLQRRHQEEIGVDVYRPWDRRAVPKGRKPLRPFENTTELVEKSATIFQRLDPRFATLINEMNARGMLDLDSRKGKAPGGFCSALPISQLSFIFMNASTSHSDLVTFLHEMGHCIHNDLKTGLPLNAYRETPMESSELASMTMELFTMDQWHLFYENEAELMRAKRQQLKGIVDFLPTGMVIDQFQHWLYENPDHSPEERNNKYLEISQQLDANVADWSGYEEWAKQTWLPVLHIFEVPFYYIEYVIAQLGALQMYRQYRQHPEQALENYKKALSLGSSKSLPEIYEAAGIRFDFSEEMIKELINFVEAEIAAL